MPFFNLFINPRHLALVVRQQRRGLALEESNRNKKQTHSHSASPEIHLQASNNYGSQFPSALNHNSFSYPRCSLISILIHFYHFYLDNNFFWTIIFFPYTGLFDLRPPVIISNLLIFINVELTGLD